MTTTVRGKEEEIGRLLAEGNKPAELIQRGFKRGTVYKVNRRLQTAGTPPDFGERDVDASIENDPSVVSLKKALRESQLSREIDEVKGLPSSEGRLLALEVKVDELEATLDEAIDAYQSLKAGINGSPLRGLRENFKCECGETGLVAVKVECTRCSRETTYGWRPTD